jgi:CheY-like chemotaxis protein
MELSAAEERERRRLAAVLHDDLQQHLAYIKVRARLAATPPGGGIDSLIQHEFEEIEGLVQESITKCRNLCYDLTPPELYREGLVAALECTIDDFRERYGLDIELTADPASEPESSILSSMLFRSIRELLNNIVKHAGAGAAEIEISREDGEIRVWVTDAGMGCDLAEVRARRGAEAGFGLFNIADRMTFLGGGAEFTSAEGQGFQASLWVPKHFEIPSQPSSPPLLTEIPRSAGVATKAAAATPEEPATIRILIVDDHDLMRAGLAELIQGHPDLQVAGEAADGVEAVRLAFDIQPDVILMDVSMPRMNGIDASTEILRANPAIRIIGISMNTDAATRRKMREAGACAFFSKAGSFEELILEIRRGRKDLPCAG